MNEAVDVVANFSATYSKAIGAMPHNIVSPQLRDTSTLHWLWYASINAYDRVAWPTKVHDGLCVTHYAPAADVLVHLLVPPDVIENGRHTGVVQLRVGTVNILSATDGPPAFLHITSPAVLSFCVFKPSS